LETLINRLTAEQSSNCGCSKKKPEITLTKWQAGVYSKNLFDFKCFSMSLIENDKIHLRFPFLLTVFCKIMSIKPNQMVNVLMQYTFKQ